MNFHIKLFKVHVCKFCLFRLVFKHIQNSIGVNFKPSYNTEATNTDQIEIVKINDELNSIHPGLLHVQCR